MKGFRKADEMEMSVNLNAVRIAWVYSLLFLLVWVVLDWVGRGSFNSVAFILMSSDLLVFWTVQFYLKWKLGQDEE